MCRHPSRSFTNASSKAAGCGPGGHRPAPAGASPSAAPPLNATLVGWEHLGVTANRDEWSLLATLSNLHLGETQCAPVSEHAARQLQRFTHGRGRQERLVHLNADTSATRILPEQRHRTDHVHHRADRAAVQRAVIVREGISDRDIACDEPLINPCAHQAGEAAVVSAGRDERTEECGRIACAFRAGDEGAVPMGRSYRRFREPAK
mmetsp:Transcript_9243/g.21472  ORF Transcript_9243/g.21472 Transcript_9243/m.21472 type:complete len:206 (+) Transcript_9243:68-685(+)